MEPITAALYLRCSSAQQEMSIVEQRNEMVGWAKENNYNIVAEYVDEGKSGSKEIKKRIAFGNMIEDALSKKFSAIICYDTSRFGRHHSLDNPHVKKLMDAKVILHTKKEKLFDWRDMQGRMMWQFFCEANHMVSTTISDKSLLGRKHIANAGLWATGKIPFGYDKLYFMGEEEVLIKRTVSYRKGKGWHLKLVISNTEADTVKEIFKRFTTTDISLRQLAADLNNEHFPSGGLIWTAKLLKELLTNTCYIGNVSWGNRSHAREKFNSAKVEEKLDVCPALIDKDTFQKTQEIITRRCVDKNKGQTVRAGLLSGFLICDLCGHKMCKKKSHKNTIYVCDYAGKNKGVPCKMWSVEENEMTSFIINFLMMNVTPQLMRMLQTETTKEQPKGISDILKNRVDELRRKIEEGREGALFAPPSERAGCWKRVEELKDELIQAERDCVAHGAPISDVIVWWTEISKQLIQSFPDITPIEEFVKTVKREQFRALLRDIGLTVRISFKKSDGTTPKVRGRVREWIVDKRSVSIRILPRIVEDSEIVDVKHSITIGCDILTICLI